MNIIKCLLLSSLFFISSISFAGDPKLGKEKAAVCAACHGQEGISNSPLWPNLAGQKENYLIKQIKAFKSGDRKDPSMAPMVAALSDKDIENLAAYYSSLKACK